MCCPRCLRLICFALIFVTSPVIASDSLKSVIISDVPHVRQKPDFCGEACVAMALRKLGKAADQDFVFDQSGLAPIEGRGCYTKELAQAVRRAGFDAGPIWYKINPDTAETELDKIFKLIHSDLLAGHMSVVCMRYDDHPNSTEHFRLIVGYDGNRDEVIYHESATANGDYQRMSRKMFIKLWPLKYSQHEWTIVLMRLCATDRLQGFTATEFTDADYAQHIRSLKRSLPGDGFHIVLAKPFVVIGDDPPEAVRKHSANTVDWAVKRLKQDYFSIDPLHIVDIWLFRDKNSYEENCIKLFQRKPSTPFGYYSSSDQALVMNISTGGGTLVHEIVHPFIESNFPDCPSWFNEGLASLYEQCRDKNGHIWGSTNWRLNGLKDAIAANRVPPFETLCSTTTHEFYRKDPGTNYAQARYLCFYLQEQGLLIEYFHKFRQNVAHDPGGYKTLQDVLGTQNMDAFQKRWEAYTAALSF